MRVWVKMRRRHGCEIASEAKPEEHRGRSDALTGYDDRNDGEQGLERNTPNTESS